MKPDLYTKAILTAIALLLTVMVSKPYIDKPEPVVKTEPAPFAGVQVTPIFNPYNYSFFDTRTGDLWAYLDDSPNHKTFSVKYLGKFTKLGQLPVPNDYKR